MRKKVAYISAAWTENEFENTEMAATYSRKVYEAGYYPVCPRLLYPVFLDNGIPREHKDSLDMSMELLRKSHVLVICGETLNSEVMNDIAIAKQFGMIATTLDGIMHVSEHGKKGKNTL